MVFHFNEGDFFHIYGRQVVSPLYSVSSESKTENAAICASLCSRQAVGGVCVCAEEAGGPVNRPRAPVRCPWTAGTQLMTAGLGRINIHHDYLLHLLALVPWGRNTGRSAAHLKIRMLLGGEDILAAPHTFLELFEG